MGCHCLLPTPSASPAHPEDAHPPDWLTPPIFLLQPSLLQYLALAAKCQQLDSQSQIPS